MEKKAVFLILMLFFIASCITRHTDYLTAFRIGGTVSDKDISIPIKNVIISFVDKDYDYVISKKNHILKIGESDERGIIDHDFEYFWGRNKAWVYSKPSKAFEILLTKEKYKEKRLLFKESDLRYENEHFTVPLGAIFLEKED
jgi:hypothetical protein